MTILNSNGTWRHVRSFQAMVSAIIITIVCCAIGQSFSPKAQAQTFNDPGFTSEIVTTLPPFTPAGITWATDGRMFIWQKDGLVRIFKNGQLLATPFIDLRGVVNTFDDRGFVGLALHPNFLQNGFAYLAYVHEPFGNPNDNGPKISRFSRVTVDSSSPDVAPPSSEVVLLQIPAEGQSHTIDSIVFAQDGKILISNGDGGTAGFAEPNALRSQDLNSLNGKILRVNEDGSAPGDNPFDDGTNSNRSKVLSYGLRNPYRFTIHPTTFELYLGDVGWNTYEEFDRGKGKNFGWPCYEGASPQSLYQSSYPAQCAAVASDPLLTLPLLTYDHSIGQAAVGGPFYTGTVYPQQYLNNWFVSDYGASWIRRLIFDAAGNLTSSPFFATNAGAPVTIAQGPDGLLYYVSFTSGQIRRIRYNGPSAAASAAPSSGLSPLTVTFSSAGSSDPTSGTLTYFWDFGDGNTSSSANPVHVYVAGSVQSFTARLTVTSSTNSQTSSATTVVTVGSRPPTATISAPINGVSVSPGQTIIFQGSATDPDQIIPASGLSWTVLNHHNDHIHTFVSATGTQGSFVAQDHGIGTYSYEIILTATDSSGLTNSTSVTLPNVGDTTPPSSPTNLIATAVSPSQINLSWTASTDNGQLTGYRVERCQGAGCTSFVQIATPTTNAFSDAGLLIGTSYSYRVRASDAAGNLSGYSNVSTATTQGVADTIPPSDVTGVTASAVSSTQINLNWTASTDSGGSGLAGYRVERCQGAGCTTFVQVATPVTNSYNDTGLATSTSYSYQVRAQDGAGNFSLNYSNVASATTTAPATGLVAAYAFNEGTGTTIGDASGNTNTGTLTNGPTWNVAGKFGAAVNFDGVNDHVLVPHSASLNLTTAMTLEAWVNPSVALSNWKAILQKEQDTYFLTASSDQQNRPASGFTLSTGVCCPFVYATSALVPTTWTHVAATYNGAQIQLYINGVPVSSTPATGSIQTTTTPLRIGGNTYATEFFQGMIDELRIYNRALTAAEILSDMNTPIGPQGPDTTPPSDVTGVTATAISATQINLSWTAATDNVGVTGYRVERCQGAGCTTFVQIATPATPSYSDLSLTASTSYSYRVKAVDAATNVSVNFSTVASSTTQAPSDTTPPSDVTGVTATVVSPTQINLSWAAATDNVGVTGYRVERCQGAGCTSFVQIATPAGTTFGDTTLAASTSYSYRVKAVDAATNVSVNFSTVASATTSADTTAPTAPGGLSATPVGGTQINLIWTAATDNVGVTGYRVERCQGAGCTTFLQIATPTGTTFGDTGLTVGTTYRYQVRAVDAASNLSPYSAIASATTAIDTTAPTAPSALTATGLSSTQINLSWTAATDNVGVTGYQVERCQGAGCTIFVQIAAPTGTTFGDTGLTVGSSYSYRVRATDAASNLSGYSNVATAVPPDTTAPSAPTTLVATAATSTQVNLTWTTSTDNVAVTLYRIERCQGTGCATFAEIGTSATTSFSNTGLTASTSYSYRVRAADAAGNLSGYSNVSTAATPVADTTKPSTPTGLAATAVSNTQINLTWNPSTDNVGVTGYRVFRCNSSATCTPNTRIATTTTNSYSNTGLTASTTYRYRVRAVDAAGNLSALSSVASATTPIAP